MTARSDRWGCPDWRDKDAYPAKPDELEDWEWRWEFLRRSSKYRKYWTETAISIPDETNVTLPIYEADVAYRVAPVDKYEEGVLLFSMYEMPDPASAELRNNPFVINAEGLAHIGFGVDFLLKHCEDEAKRKHFLTWLVRVNHWVDYSKRDTPEDDSICSYYFDLLKPLDQQITQARATLNKLQDQSYPDFEQFKNKRRKNWPRHLRVIDAHNQGETPMEICLEILGTELDVKEYDEKVGGNVSQFGKNMIKDALQIMEKASRFL
jgi:hypothetical protein